MKPIKPLDKYTIEELRRLYKSFTLYIVTEYIKRELTRQSRDYRYEMVSELDVDDNDTKHYKSHFDVRFFNGIEISNLENKLEIEGENLSDTTKQNIHNKIYYHKICREVIFWFGGCFEDHCKRFENGCEVTDPDELLGELHFNDEMDREFDRATKEEIYRFIWETLRFCDVPTLKRLLEHADKKFEIAPAHRPKNNKKIFKYDKNGKLLSTFKDREDCINSEGIKKAALSLVLSGKRKSLNGFIYKEEETVN